VEVTAEDLTKPLGLEMRRRRIPAIRLPLTPILAGLLVSALGGAVALVSFNDDPLAGQPHAIVAIELGSAPIAGEPKQPPAGEAGRTVPAADDAPGVSVVRPNGAAPGALIIRIPDADAGKLAPAPDRRLVERSRYGLLPKIGDDGAKPWQVYARPLPPLPGGARAKVRIALLVTGLGISESATTAAIAKLPPAVTLAFAPYGRELDRQAAAARAEGRELMLQIPMEPLDYPDNDPGPHTLTTRAKLQDNLDKLHWAMGRFTGYIGLVNFMGAKLTADEAALLPILRETGSRGLAFLDDGASSRSTVRAAARSARLPAACVDGVIDGTPQAEAVDQELARLEELARKRGLAIGTASALPLTIERIARWARSLEAKNIQLVPISAAFSGEER
jgi:uncharacterized protein